jgi:Rrf2 family protein
MAASCRFAFAVHVLTVLAFKQREGGNSDLLAGSVNTNAVVIRRILSDLRRAGLVKTHKGAGGGARLSRPPAEISLDAVYRAMECGPSFSPHPHQPNQRCPIGRKIEVTLESIFAEAETALQEALAKRTLSDVLETVIDEPAASVEPGIS